MATKRKSMVGGNTSAANSPSIRTVSSPAARIPVVNSPAARIPAPAVRAPIVNSPAVRPPVDDEHIEQDDEDLNMSDDEEGGTRIGDIYIPPPVKPYCSTESIGPRLIITKIANSNFKSYAGDVVLGPFSNVSVLSITNIRHHHHHL